MQNKFIQQHFSFFFPKLYTHNKDHIDHFISPRPTYNLLLLHSGHASISFGEKTIEVNPRNLLFIPLGSTYSAKWFESTSFSIIHFCFLPGLDPFVDKKVEIQKIEKFNYSEIENLFNILKNTDTTDLGVFNFLSSFYQLCSKAFMNLKFSDLSINNSPIQTALNYLERHYSEKIKIKTLAVLCMMSESQFYSTFKKLTGYTPIQYKNIILIQHIQRTLLTNHNCTLEEIANTYHFESTVYLCRLFKSVTGQTPTEFKTLKFYL